MVINKYQACCQSMNLFYLFQTFSWATFCLLYTFIRPNWTVERHCRVLKPRYQLSWTRCLSSNQVNDTSKHPEVSNWSGVCVALSPHSCHMQWQGTSVAAGRGRLREQRWRSHEQRRTLLYRGPCTGRVCWVNTACHSVSASDTLPPENTQHWCLLHESNTCPWRCQRSIISSHFGKAHNRQRHTPVHVCPCRSRWGDPVHEERGCTGGSDPSQDSPNLHRHPHPPVLLHHSVSASPRYPADARI